VTRSPRLVGAVAAPALAVVLALTLSSCGTPQAGAAATVGDRRISVSAVQTAYRDVVSVVGQDAQITQTQILNLLILEPYLIKAAAAQGQGVSPQDARLDIQKGGKVKASSISSAGLGVWRANMAVTALQSDQQPAQVTATFNAIGAELRKAGVHINPRYGGKIDYKTFSIAQETPDWLVTKAPAVQATPGATPTPEATPTP
jgi:hypothetical protein